MKRKRMTQKVVAGLISLSSIVGAGGPDDIVGYRDEQLEMPEFQETRKVLGEHPGGVCVDRRLLSASGEGGVMRKYVWYLMFYGQPPDVIEKCVAEMATMNPKIIGYTLQEKAGGEVNHPLTGTRVSLLFNAKEDALAMECGSGACAELYSMYASAEPHLGLRVVAPRGDS